MNLLRPFLPRLAPRPSAPAHAHRTFLCDPDAPLLVLNRYGDALSVSNFFEGIFAFGATGAGKSTGPGRAMALAMLRAGWGGLVLCAKPGESEVWADYLRETGRSADLIHMRPGSGLTFNFVDYEVHRPDGLGAETFNLVALIEVMADALQQSLAQNAQGEQGAFWIAARREILTNAIEPLVAATGRFRLDELMRFVTTAPTSMEEARSDSWKAQSFCYWALKQAHDHPAGAPLPIHAMRAATDYWFVTYAGLDARTRSNIVATLTAAISPFLRGTLHDSFCTTTSVIPEMTHEGAVLVVDYPIKTLGAAAVVAAHIMKYQWQKATERRLVGLTTRPVFVMADEYHLLTAKYDPEFQSTARSARAATVYLTQNLPGLYAQLPGRDPKSAAESLLGNFQTKLFLANTDAVTNQYAAELIGKTPQRRASANWSVNQGRQRSTSESNSRSWQYGRNRGSNAGSNASFGHSNGPSGGTYSSSSGYSSGSQSGYSRSWSWGTNSTDSESASSGTSDGGGWSEQVDYTVPPVAFASKLRKGGAANGGLVDAVIVQGGRRFAATGSHWLHCTFKQKGF